VRVSAPQQTLLPSLTRHADIAVDYSFRQAGDRDIDLPITWEKYLCILSGGIVYS